MLQAKHKKKRKDSSVDEWFLTVTSWHVDEMTKYYRQSSTHLLSWLRLVYLGFFSIDMIYRASMAFIYHEDKEYVSNSIMGSIRQVFHPPTLRGNPHARLESEKLPNFVSFLNHSGEYGVFLPVVISERVDLPINLNRIILQHLIKKIFTRKSTDPMCITSQCA